MLYCHRFHLFYWSISYSLYQVSIPTIVAITSSITSSKNTRILSILVWNIWPQRGNGGYTTPKPINIHREFVCASGVRKCYFFYRQLHVLSVGGFHRRLLIITNTLFVFIVTIYKNQRNNAHVLRAGEYPGFSSLFLLIWQRTLLTKLRKSWDES